MGWYFLFPRSICPQKCHENLEKEALKKVKVEVLLHLHKAQYDGTL